MFTLSAPAHIRIYLDKYYKLSLRGCEAAEAISSVPRRSPRLAFGGLAMTARKMLADRKNLDIS